MEQILSLSHTNVSIMIMFICLLLKRLGHQNASYLSSVFVVVLIFIMAVQQTAIQQLHADREVLGKKVLEMEEFIRDISNDLKRTNKRILNVHTYHEQKNKKGDYRVNALSLSMTEKIRDMRIVLNETEAKQRMINDDSTRKFTNVDSKISELENDHYSMKEKVDGVSKDLNLLNSKNYQSLEKQATKNRRFEKKILENEKKIQQNEVIIRKCEEENFRSNKSIHDILFEQKRIYETISLIDEGNKELREEVLRVVEEKNSELNDDTHSTIQENNIQSRSYGIDLDTMAEEGIQRVVSYIATKVVEAVNVIGGVVSWIGSSISGFLW